VRLEQYDMVSAALIWVIGQALGADFDAVTRDAWKAALADVCAAMKEGAHRPACPSAQAATSPNP
jgi:hemoglobin-like flavoprotein